MSFQRRAWVIERAGWIMLGLVLMVALAGFFGDGPTSERTVGEPPLTVQYERYQRFTKQARYLIKLGPANGERQILLSPPFQQSYDIASIEPRPLRSTASAEGLGLRFAPAPDGDLTVVIWAHPRHFGRVALDISSDGNRVRARSFVYP